MNAGQSLIAELEDAIQGGAPDKRVDTLRRITDLFVAGSDRFNDQQIGVFDDVLGHLIKRIEGKALVELSRRLGPIQNAPSDTLRRLARNDDIAVAEPILTHSARLSDDDLIEIANTKTQAHLLAISGRSHISTPVTDTLLQRGDQPVFHKLAANTGANFSADGFTSLVKRSEHDDQLAEKIGLRLDVPLPLFRELLSRATEAVRSRLLAAASPESRNHIQRVLAHISEDVRHEAGFESERDYAEAHARMLEMHRQGRLNEAALFELAKAGRHADMIAALSLLCGAPLPLLDSLLQSEHREAVLVACKAAALEWPTVRTILNRQSAGGTVSDQDLDRARGDYSKLSQSTARRVLRFWQVRKTASVTGSMPAAAASSPSAPDGSGPQYSVAKISTA
jgi:uncharacterized protein (DUF2336 family)